jgi:hypothetical protein
MYIDPRNLNSGGQYFWSNFIKTKLFSTSSKMKRLILIPDKIARIKLIVKNSRYLYFMIDVLITEI